ncbi:short-chain dehydrogenase/reductase SDR [Acephala macrosclerotiorum]|nr:short-chain dehydrogenase/reductase SDR [Acephala macrosclerotiorum]
MSSQSDPLRLSRSLAGKVAIVTGAGCKGDGIGNGRAEAILLAEDGCSVVCVDMSESDAERTCEMIKAEGHGKAIACVGNVTKAVDVERIIKTTIEAFGRLDILVNNVGIAGPAGTAETVDMEEWSAAWEVNLTSMVLMSKHAIPEMKKNAGEVKGSIVNLSSVAGFGGGLPNLLYPASKGAVVPLTKAMAANHGRDGIRVNCVAPGSPWTPMVSTSPLASEAVRTARKEGNLLGTEGTGWDTAYACRWLAGPESRWITGVIIPVDAGLAATVQMTVPKWGNK